MSSFYFIMIIIIGFIAMMVFASVTTGQKESRKKDKNSPKKEITTEMIEEVAKSGNKLEAIKLYRELHKVGLREAKEAIEEIYDERD